MTEGPVFVLAVDWRLFRNCPRFLDHVTFTTGSSQCGYWLLPGQLNSFSLSPLVKRIEEVTLVTCCPSVRSILSKSSSLLSSSGHWPHCFSWNVDRSHCVALGSGLDAQSLLLKYTDSKKDTEIISSVFLTPTK